MDLVWPWLLLTVATPNCVTCIQVITCHVPWHSYTHAWYPVVAPFTCWRRHLAFWRPIWFLWLQLSLPAPIVGPWPFTCCNRSTWMLWPTMQPLVSWAVWVQCHGSRLCSFFKRCKNEGWKRIKRHMVHWPKLLNEAVGEGWSVNLSSNNLMCLGYLAWNPYVASTECQATNPKPGFNGMFLFLFSVPW